MRTKILSVIIFCNLISNIILFIQYYFISTVNLNLEMPLIIISNLFLVLSLIIFFNIKNIKWLGKKVENVYYHIQTGYALAFLISFLSLLSSIIIWMQLFL